MASEESATAKSVSGYKNWDYKQLMTGGGGALVLMFALQNQGLEFLNRQHDEASKSLISRVESLERSYIRLDEKLERIKDQVVSGNNEIMNVIRQQYKYSYNKEDHYNYAKSIDKSFENIEDRIRALENKNR